MDIISQEHLWKIQRYTAIAALIMNLTAILVNLLVPVNPDQKTINIGTITLITIVLLATMLINKHVMRYIQVTVFLLIGIFTTLFDTENQYLGDILFITGVLLAYTYRILSTYSHKTIVIIIIITALLRLASGMVNKAGNLTKDITTALFSIALILYLVTLLKNELIWYIKESRKNDMYIRAGMNITGFAHGMDLGTAINTLKTIKRKIESGDYNRALHFADNLEQVLIGKNTIKESILFSANQSRTTVEQDVDVHKNLEAILDLVCLNKDVLTKIKIRRDYYSRKLIVHAVPFEIHFIFQNIIVNAVEAMFIIDKQHVLDIRTSRQKNTACVCIADTGPGFRIKNNSNLPDYGASSSEKGSIGGFGLFYTFGLVKRNNMLLELHNKKEGGGAEAILTFTVKGEQDV